MTLNNKHIIADDGKIFIRKGTKDIMGKEIYLGYSYYIDGVLQNPPHLDVPSDFEEIDDPDTTEEEREDFQAKTDNETLLKYVNESTDKNYTDLGSAVIDLVTNK